MVGVVGNDVESLEGTGVYYLAVLVEREGHGDLARGQKLLCHLGIRMGMFLVLLIQKGTLGFELYSLNIYLNLTIYILFNSGFSTAMDRIIRLLFFF